MPACTLTVEVPPGGVVEIPDLTGELTATDNRTPLHLLIVEQDPPAGTLVSVGAYIITTTITDQSGNTTTCTNIFCVTAGAGPGPFLNTAQSFTAFCPDGTTGTSKTAVIPAGTYSSNTSQADADSQALAAAVAQANAALCCCVPGEDCPECPEIPDCPDPYTYVTYGYDLYDGVYPYGYGCYPPPTIPSYVINHWWKMDECGTNTIRRDAIGTADLTPSVVAGTNGCAVGKVGNANAQTGTVNIQTTSTELNYFNNGMTFFGWIKNDRTLGAGAVFIDYEFLFLGSPNDRLRILGSFPVSPGTDVTFVISEDVTGTPLISGLFPNGIAKWLFFIATHNGANGTLTLEVKDGINHLIITTAAAWIPATHSTARIFFYGNDARYFDECGIIYRILTQAEKDFLWNGGAGRSWPFA